LAVGKNLGETPFPWRAAKVRQLGAMDSLNSMLWSQMQQRTLNPTKGEKTGFSGKTAHWAEVSD
jgi:hypothetical protein